MLRLTRRITKIISAEQLNCFVDKQGDKLLLVAQQAPEITRQLAALGLEGRCVQLDPAATPQLASQVQVQAPALLFLRNRVVMDLACHGHPRDIIYGYFGVKKDRNYFEGLIREARVDLFLQEVKQCPAATEQLAEEIELARSRDVRRAARLYSRNSQRREIYLPILQYIQRTVLATLNLQGQPPEQAIQTLLDHHLYQPALEMLLKEQPSTASLSSSRPFKQCIEGLSQQSPRHKQLIARAAQLLR